MPIVGEEVFFSMGAAWNGIPLTATWSFDLPPSSALAKVGFTFYMPYAGPDGQDDMVSPGIMSFRRRLPSGADEVVPNNNDPAAGDTQMTNVTVGMYMNDVQARMTLVIEFWE